MDFSDLLFGETAPKNVMMIKLNTTFGWKKKIIELYKVFPLRYAEMFGYDACCIGNRPDSHKSVFWEQRVAIGWQFMKAPEIQWLP